MPLKGALLGMGNPLLDVSSNVDQAFLDKYQVGAWHPWMQAGPAGASAFKQAVYSPKAGAFNFILCG
jgi:hypothetical protein